MKRLLLILFIAFFSSLAGLSPENRIINIEKANSIDAYKRIRDAIAFIESSNNPNAYNKIEKATGLYQIRPIRLRDYNEKANKNYKLSDMYDPKISNEIFMFYARKFRYNDYESISRDWNGKYGHTDKYWKRVKSVLFQK